MKSFSVLLTVIIAFCSLFVSSQEQETSLLWEIKGKRVKSPSYLFGTMHLIPKSDFYFPDELQGKVAESDKLVMEIGGLSNQMAAMKYMIYKEGNVFELFSSEQKDSLFTYMESELGLNRDEIKKQYGKLKPLALMQVLTQNSFGESPESYELRLEMIAKEHDLKIEGLETIEEQVAIFDNMPYNEQVRMVMTSLHQADESANETRKLIELYLSQDVNAMAQMVSESEMGSSNFEEDFLINRNKRWIPLIEKMIRKDRCFIAVGAAHLGGENGVIQLLRNAGYSVEPVKF